MTASDRASGDGRRRVVDAARVCFAESGLAGSTMKAVAQRAGVTEGAVYYHFESKQALFEEVVREPLERLVHGLGELNAGNDPETTSGATHHLNATMFETMRQLVPLFGVAVFSDIPLGKSWYSTVASPLLDTGAEATAHMVPDLRSDIPLDLMFRALVGMHMGLAIDSLLSGDDGDTEQVCADIDGLVSLEGPVEEAPSQNWTQ